MIDLAADYVLWTHRLVPRTYNGESFDDLGSVRRWELWESKPLAKRRPKGGVVLRVKNGDPKNPIVADNLYIKYLYVIVSERLKSVLEHLKIADVEYLPLTLKTLSGKRLKARYFFAHFLRAPQCLDYAASGAKVDRELGTGLIEKLSRLAFTRNPNRAIFKPAHYQSITLVRRDIAERLAEAEITGLQLAPLFSHPESSRAPKPRSVKDWVDALNAKMEKGRSAESDRGKPGKELKQFLVPTQKIKRWAAGVDRKRTYCVRGDDFKLALGDTSWHGSYRATPDARPAFQPNRYYCIATNRDGNYYLLDLARRGTVVYFDHERGYNEKENFRRVAKNLDAIPF